MLKKRSTILCLLFLLLTAGLLGVSLIVAESQDPMDNAGEAQFLRAVATACLFKMEAGRIANRQAAAQEVRDFGGRMSEQYAALLSSARGLARKKNISLPEGLDPASQHTLSYLTTLILSNHPARGRT